MIDGLIGINKALDTIAEKVGEVKEKCMALQSQNQQLRLANRVLFGVSAGLLVYNIYKFFVDSKDVVNVNDIVINRSENEDIKEEIENDKEVEGSNCSIQVTK